MHNFTKLNKTLIKQNNLIKILFYVILFYFDAYINLLNLYESTNDIFNLKLLIDSAYKNFKEKEEKNILIFFDSLRLNREGKFRDSADLILNSNLDSAFKKNKIFKSSFLILNQKIMKN